MELRGGAWSLITNIKGADGANGSDGAPGAQGVGVSSATSGSPSLSGNYTITPVTLHLTNGQTTSFNVSAQRGEQGPAPSTSQILDMVYPVGSIYMSVNNVSPQTFIGGTWVAWGAGRVPVSVDTTDSDFNTVEKTGGAKTVALTTDQMPGHTHSCAQALTQSSIANQIGLNYNDVNASGYFSIGRSSNNYGSTNSGTRKTNLYGNFSHSHTIGTTGRGFAHNNLQPYITCYMWKRTA